jgi:hypothetical protein
MGQWTQSQSEELGSGVGAKGSHAADERRGADADLNQGIDVRHPGFSIVACSINDVQGYDLSG